MHNAGKLQVRLQSEQFEADISNGEEASLRKLEEFTGREFEMQFACVFRRCAHCQRRTDHHDTETTGITSACGMPVPVRGVSVNGRASPLFGAVLGKCECSPPGTVFGKVFLERVDASGATEIIAEFNLIRVSIDFIG